MNLPEILCFSLHSTMFLLNLFCAKISITLISSLHSTMFLLNQSQISYPAPTLLSLHSTMFLLNPMYFCCDVYMQNALHSTMFLLNRFLRDQFGLFQRPFTFHDVSIKSCMFDVTRRLIQVFTFHDVSIKSLLRFALEFNATSLYIPRCFY